MPGKPKTKGPTLQSVKSSLKSRAPERSNQLTLRLGIKKHVLPANVRLLTKGSTVFLHIPSTVILAEVTDQGLQPIEDLKTAQAAAKDLRAQPRSPRSRASSQAPELSQELVDALAKIPAGYKLVFDSNLKVRLAKTRTKRKITV